MAITTYLPVETHLVGRIVTSNVETDSLIIYATFEDRKTGDAREPQSTTKLFMLSKDTERAELVYASSHSTTDGITTLIIPSNGRKLNKYGDLSGNATGFRHPINQPIGCATSHLPVQQCISVLDGTLGTGANIFRIGDETASDVIIYAQNDQANKPFFKYDEATSKWVFSNDGTSSTDVGGGTGTITAGDGVDVTAGVVSLDIKADSGLKITSAELDLDIRSNYGLLADSNGLYIDLATNAGLEFDTGQLGVKLKSGGGLTVDGDGLSSEQTLGIINVVAGETLVPGDTVYFKGTDIVEIDADESVYIDQAAPATNYDGAGFIRIGGSSGSVNVKRGLVHFDISAQASSVVKAYIRLEEITGTANTTGLTVKLRADNLTGGFDETTVNWNSQPGADGTTTDSNYAITNGHPVGAKYIVDITTIYNTKWNVNNYGVRMQWDDEATAATTHLMTLGRSTDAKLILIVKGDDWGKAFKVDSAARVPSFKGVVTVGGSAGETITVTVAGTSNDATGLSEFNLYKASTSGGFTSTTDLLEAQMQSFTSTSLRVMDKMKEYSTDIFATEQTIYENDLAITEIAAGTVLDNITITGFTDSGNYDIDGYYIAKPSANGNTARAIGMATVDVF